jgi:hypothetical protein
MTASVPLTDVLPSWDDGNTASTILVCDSLQTDGRFLFSTVAASSVMKNVLWLGCGSQSSKQIATSLKKLGLDSASTFMKQSLHETDDDDNFWKRPLHIHSLTVEMSERLLMEEAVSFDGQAYLKEIYNRIRIWLQSSSESSFCCVILDDVSALATLLGDALIYCFVASVRALCRTTSATFFLRCWHDAEQSTKPLPVVTWIGAGGRSTVHSLSSQLVEIADYIVDTIPLASGGSREAHGRLVISATRRGTATSNNNNRPVLVVNYCLQDTIVTAIRLQTTGSSH